MNWFQIKRPFLACVCLVASLFSVVAMSQTPERMIRTTAERNLESLLEAISTFDDGNRNLIYSRGQYGGGSEIHSALLQVTSDERVRKIFALLKEMPSEEAASIVRNSYQKDLRQLKKTTLEGKVGIGLSYGVHAKLWLVYQFDSLSNFNRNFNDWNDWYVDSLISEEYLEANISTPGPIRKSSFASAASPELMMYLNIVLNEQANTDELTDKSLLAKKLADAGMTSSLTKSIGLLQVMPFDAELNDPTVESLLEIPVFRDWVGLDALEIEKRAALISEVRKLVDENGVILTSIEDAAESLLSLGGILDLDTLVKLERLKASQEKTGTRIEFLGSNTEERLAQGWYAERLPTKQQLMSAVKRLVKKVPPNERSDWEKIIEELRNWVSEVPDSGIDVGSEEILNWPSPDKSKEELPGDTDLDERQILKIRIWLKKTKALNGELERHPPESSKELCHECSLRFGRRSVN